MIDNSPSRRTFRVVNACLLGFYALFCLVPMYHVLCLSLSSSTAVAAGKVTLVPVDFTLKSYQFIFAKTEYWRAMGMSFLRIGVGVPFIMLMIVLAAYPLSKASREFKAQPFFAWFFVFTMIFSGGMIPTYMVVRYTGLLNTIWALILPVAVPVFNILLMLNFFRSVPCDIEESAFIDGAGHWRILFQIYIPVSLPAMATLIVFTVVGQWNAWFDGMLYMNDQTLYPLQTYLQAVLVAPTAKLITKAYAELMRVISDRTLKSAQVFIAAIPVLLIYPFLQNYFISGIMLGSVKE